MSTSTTEHDGRDEETPLLRPSSPDGKTTKKRTPLPMGQMTILLLLQLAEPITSQCILPFINQLIGELDITGGDETKVGYYAGLIESLFFVAEAITVLQWSRLSDHVGRKPILLIGTFGMIISMVSFGLSRTFWTLVISRCICGALNGNIGVMKSMVADITDETNLSQALSLMPVTWAVGSTIGPLMGGQLSRPATRFPEIFGSPFWRQYPYFLPCGVAAAFTTLSLVLAAFFLKESLPKDTSSTHPPSSDALRSQAVMDLAEGATLEHTDPSYPVSSSDSREKPLPLRALLTAPVVLSVSNYATLALLDIALFALMPLFMSTHIEHGGLGLPPSTIGLCLGIFGLSNGVFQALFFTRIVDYWGPKLVFMAAMSSFIPIFALFPVTNTLARAFGLSTPVWIGVAAQFTVMILMDMAYGCVFVFILSSAPNKRSLGATNGLAQTVISVQRAIGPVMSTSLFALSVEKNIMGGHGVYFFLIVLCCLSLILAAKLPRRAWNAKTEE
ncbi:MFS general substrate transporter [Dentipellis sp. KUC8613]|nr:MFS general substrate transporter [Dentipellis sp. KUC8613]